MNIQDQNVKTAAIIIVCSSVNNTPTHSAVTATQRVPVPASAIRIQDGKWGGSEEKSVAIDVTPRVIHSLLLPRTFLRKIIVLIVHQESLVLVDGKTVVTQSRHTEPHSGLPSHYQHTGLNHQENPDIPEESLYPLKEHLIILTFFWRF